MTRIRWLTAAMLAVALLPGALRAQQTGTVSGAVVEAGTQRPLNAAQVVVVGTNRGARTDASGRFTITGVPAGAQRLQATLVGFAAGEQRVTVTAGQTVTANFELAASAVQLSGIVVNAVTGQAQSRRELGTNVGNINASDIATAPITKPADVLTGRSPGVTVQAASGTAGTSQRIRIRGANSLSLSNEPLIYVDGVLFNNAVQGLGAGGAASSRLNDINPADIANIEILKGPAATSQYGTAAANGVILITTKRGTSGRGRWNAYTEYGTIEDKNDWPTNFFTYQVNQPNAPLFLPTGRTNVGTTNTAARRQCYNHQAAQGLCRQDSTATFNTMEDPRTTPLSVGHRRKTGLSVSGGNAGTTYFLSGDYEGEQGVISYNKLNKINVRANVNADVTDKLRFQVSSAYVDSDLDINSNNNSVFSPIINGFVGRAFFNPDTTTAMFNQNYRLFSPQALAEYVPSEDINRLTLGGQANYKPLGWLNLNANAGLDWTNRFYQLTLQPNRPLGVIAPSFFGIGFRDALRANTFLWTANASSRAEFDLTDRIRSVTTLGGSFQRDQSHQQFGEGAGIVEGTRSLSTSTGQFTLTENFFEIRTIGAFATQQFSFEDRFFLTLGIRGDDNSAFGQDFGFVTYPNANASWVLSEESWFPATSLVSDFRLRAGYGTSGLRPSFRDAVTLFGPAGVQVAGSDQPAVLLSTTGNTGLEPEKTTEYELGFDAGLFNERLTANLTYYNKTSDDAIISVPLPPSFGLTATRLANLGKIRNSGLELQLDARVLDTENHKLNLRLSTTTLDNEVLSIGGINDILVGRGDQRHREGFPAGAFFQDRYVYQDVNGDGKLDPRQNLPLSQREIRIVRDTVDGKVVPNFIGPALPTLSNALTADLTVFKYVTLSTLFEQRGGNYQLDFSTEFRCRTAPAFGDRGCEHNASPTATLEQQAAYLGSSVLGTRYGFIHKADFIKWRELSVTLGMPESLGRGLLNGASLTLSGRNLKTWTDYPGMDPEVAEFATGAAGNFAQNEFNSQPPVRYFTARLNFTF